MNKTTEPIRNMKTVNTLLTYLKGQSYRNYMLAKVQLNTAFRISDIVVLKTSDFFHQNGYLRENVIVKEQKTGKVRSVAINQSLKVALKEYVDLMGFDYDLYLFPSRKGTNKPITVTQAQRIFQNAGEQLHLDNFNSHSLRKTWGFFAYKKTKNIALIMRAFGHNSEQDTLRYIGITQKDNDDLYKQINF